MDFLAFSHVKFLYEDWNIAKKFHIDVREILRLRDGFSLLQKDFRDFFETKHIRLFRKHSIVNQTMIPISCIIICGSTAITFATAFEFLI